MLGQLEQRHLTRIADIDRIVHRRLHEPPDALDEIGHVGERARLGAVAVYGQGLAPESLADEGGDGAAVREPHAAPIGVEDPHDARVDLMEAVIGHGDGFGEALGFVVDAAGAHRIDVAPVVLALRVHEGIAVDLRGGGEEEAGAPGLGEAESAIGPERADLEGLDGIIEVVDRARRTREVQHPIERTLDLDEVRDIVQHELKAGMLAEVGDVGRVTGEEIVHSDDAVILCQQPVAQMRPEKPRGPGYEDAHATGRPILSYTNPRRARRCGSYRLRPSTIKGRDSACLIRPKSGLRYSSHSVTITSAAAPSSAS